MDPVTQVITSFLTKNLSALNNAIGPLLALIGNTPLNLTTSNAVVNGAWITMTGVADAFLGLYIVIKLIQTMHGEATGTTHMPVGQFVGKVILTVILIHASAFMSQQLLLITNALSALVGADAQKFAMQVNGGKAFSDGQNAGLFLVLGFFFGLGLVRITFQAIKRVIFFNILYALSGPAFLMSLDAQTAPWFAFWLRTHVVNILTQFFQVLALSLGFQFFLAARQTGFTGFILAIAMLYATAEIPSLLARFASSAGANTPGVGSLVRSAMTTAMLLIR